MIPVGTAVGYLTLDYTQFRNNLNTALGEATSLSGKFSKTLGEGFSTIGQQFTNVGTKMTTGLTVPIGMATASTIKFGAEFDKQMSNVKSVSNATEEQINQMRDATISWGEKTVYTAAECSDALYYMSLAGWKPEESIAALGSVLNLAAASNLDLGRTSDIVTDAMTAMGYEAGECTNGIENTAYFTNVLAAAMSNSNTTVDLMGESFKYVAPLAGSLKSGMDDLALAIGLMANVGVKGTQAGTGLRQALKNLIDPTDDMQAAMDKYGVSLFDTNGNAKDMRTFMEELRGTFNGLNVDIYDANGELKTGEQIMEEYGHALPTSQQEKLNAIVEIFGTRALPGILGIIDQSDEKFNSLADAIDNSSRAFVEHDGEIYSMSDAIVKFGEDAIKGEEGFRVLGAAEGMAMTQMDNLQGDWTKFTSALGTSKILLTDLANNYLREFVQKLTDLIKEFNSLDDEQKKQIIKLITMTATVGPLLLMFGKLVSGIGNVIVGFNRMSEALNKIKVGSVMLGTKLKNVFEGVKLARAGFTGLAAEASPLGATIGSLGTKFKNFFEAIKLSRAGFSGLASEASPLGAILGGLSAPILALIAVVVVLVAAFVHLWKNNEEFRNKVKEIWDGIVNKFKEAGQKITDAINSLGFDFESLEEAIKAAWDWICNALAPILIGIFDTISNAISGVIDIFVGVFQIIIGVIKGFKDGDWSLFIEGLKTLWNGVWTIIKAPFVTFFNFITGVIESFGLTWSDIWNGIKNFFIDLWNGIKNFFVSVWNGIVNFITTLGTTLKNIFVNVFTAIKTTIQNVFNNIKTFIHDTVENIKTAAVEKFTTMKDTVVNTIHSFKEGILNKIDELKTKFFTTVENIKTSISNRFTEMKNSVIETITSLKTKATEKIQEVKDGIVNTFSNIKKKFEDIGANIVNGIKEGITNAWDKFTGWLSDKIGGLVDFCKGVLGISSPSKVFANEVGVWLPPGIANGFEEALPKAISSMEKSLNEEISDFDVRDIDIIGLSETFKSVVTDVSDWFVSIEERLADTVNSIKTDLANLIEMGQLVISSDAGISGLLVNKNSSLDINRPGKSSSDNGEVVNNFTFYSNESIDEIKAAKLLKETQRDLAEGYL